MEAVSGKLLVLYHASCFDGFCAAWIVHRVYPDAEFVPVQYGQDPPDVRGRNVLIVDFSWPRSRLIAMKESAANLEVLDHHKTAQADFFNENYCSQYLSICNSNLLDVTDLFDYDNYIMARPKKDPALLMNTDIRIPVTADQKRLIADAVASEKIDLSAWARGILLEAAQDRVGRAKRAKGGK